MHVSMSICMYIYLSMHVSMSICMYIYLSMHVSIEYMYVYICMHVSMYVRGNTCMYISSQHINGYNSQGWGDRKVTLIFIMIVFFFGPEKKLNV